MVKRILKEVEIKNFRAISYMKLPLNKINIIVGRNNTGKTSLIEALALLLTSPSNYRDFLGNDILKVVSTHRGDLKFLIKANQDSSFVSGTLTDRTKIELYIFKSVDKVNLPENTYKKVLGALKDYIKGEAEYRVREYIKRLERRKKEQPEDFSTIIEELMKLSSFRTLYIEREAQKVLNEISPVMISVVNNEGVNVAINREILGSNTITLTEVSLEPIYVRMYSAKRVVEELGKIPLDKVIIALDKLRSLIPYFYDYRSGSFVFKYGEYYEIIPTSAVGDGFLALFELMLTVVFGININLIEEPELHMHPGFMEKFIEELLNIVNNYNIQYIMTTHSLEFLDYLVKTAYDKNLLNLVEVIRLYRLQNGEVDYEILSGGEAYEELVELHGDLRGL